MTQAERFLQGILDKNRVIVIASTIEHEIGATLSGLVRTDEENYILGEHLTVIGVASFSEYQDQCRMVFGQAPEFSWSVDWPFYYRVVAE